MEKGSLLLLLWLLFSVSFVLGCELKAIPSNPNSETWQARLNDMLPNAIVRSITSIDLTATLAIKLTDTNENPLRGASFLINKDNDVRLALKSNNDGVVIIHLTSELLKKNPVITISKEGLLAKDISYEIGGKTMKFINGVSVDAEVMQFDNLPYLQNHEGFKVFYVINKEAAKLYSDSIFNAISFIETITGKSTLNPVSPLLIDKQEVSVMGEPEGMALFPLNINQWKDKYWYFIH